MSDLLDEKTPIKTRHIRPGQAQAVEVESGQLLQIQTLHGKQVADFVAFSLGDTGEFVSTSATRSSNVNIIPQKGMTLFSNRRQPMFEIVEDTVGRHDMLFAACDPVRYEKLGVPGHASCRAALTESLEEYGIGYDRIPDPVNWFMNVSIQQRGELDVREPLAEAEDFVLLRALKDVVVSVSACPQDHGPTNAGNPTDLRIRVYRDEPLIADVAPADAAASSAEAEPARASAEQDTQPVGEANASEPVTAQPAAGERTAFASRPARLRDTVEATVIRVES